MAALAAGARVRVVNGRRPVAGCEGEVIEWRGVAFHVELDGLGTHFFEPEELERCATDQALTRSATPSRRGLGLAAWSGCRARLAL
jgi:hypothetical protein